MTTAAHVHETCSCGATLDFTGTYASNAATRWRMEHKHAESVGICGDRPENWVMDLPTPHCVLKAGHAGFHGDGQGASWGYRTPNGAAESRTDPPEGDGTGQTSPTPQNATEDA